MNELKRLNVCIFTKQALLAVKSKMKICHFDYDLDQQHVITGVHKICEQDDCYYLKY